MARVASFCVSAFLAAVGGALIGPITGSATAGSFTFGGSLTVVAVLFVAGRRPVAAASLASALFVVGPSYIDDPTLVRWVPVAFGLGAIVVTCNLVGVLARRWQAGQRTSQRNPDATPAKGRLRPARQAT